MKTNSPCLTGKLAALTLALCGGCASQGHAGTITTESGSWPQSLPFGIGDTGTAGFTGRYQQIYRSGLFTATGFITQIAFKAWDGRLAGDASYTLSLALGVTAATPDVPGETFATGAATVLSGTRVVHITPAPDDFDMVFTLDTPFRYDPKRGNLLLEVTMFSAARMPGSTAEGSALWNVGGRDMATIYADPTGIIAQSRAGIVTQFTTAPVPEPGVAGLLLAGGVQSLRRRRSKIMDAPEPAHAGAR